MLFMKKLKLTTFSAWKNFANIEYFINSNHSEFSQTAPVELDHRIWNKNERKGILSMFSIWNEEIRGWFLLFKFVLVSRKSSGDLAEESSIFSFVSHLHFFSYLSLF